ncbi:MAG: fumarate hydratase, partial [Bacteroidetes bacterium]|nr:fumarate hydratase [Bacteroidota bacterium]
MKNIKITNLKSQVKNLLIEASFYLPDDIIQSIKAARERETNPVALRMLDYMLENEKIARVQKLPLCQDCGTVYINLEIGPDICLENDFTEALNNAVSEVYSECFLRKSIVSDPLFERKNTLSNIPAIINASFSSIEGIKIEVNLKGGGSENCSYLFMLNPSEGQNQIIDKVLEVVKGNVTKCCPPVIIGIGIGATASEVSRLARKASFRNLNYRNCDPRYAGLEEKILGLVNETGIGPQGVGGKTTALACNIEFAPCHMATLPVAVFLGCHSTRRAEKH